MYDKEISITSYHFSMLTDFALANGYNRESLLEVILDEYYENNFDTLKDDFVDGHPSESLFIDGLGLA